jgi:hypothetical protein
MQTADTAGKTEWWSDVDEALGYIVLRTRKTDTRLWKHLTVVTVPLERDRFMHYLLHGLLRTPDTHEE